MAQITFKQSPVKLIVSIYLILSFLFMVLYLLPFSHNGDLKPIDAWFVSVSAISVTGLSSIDVSSVLTRFGQTLLMIQIQLGGIGIMSFIAVLFLLFRKKLSLPQQTLMSFDQNQSSLKSIRRLTTYIVLVAFIIELIGFLLFLKPVYAHYRTIGDTLFISAFHAIASFTNAGFDLFGDSLFSFSTVPMMVIPTALLIFLGVLGFPIYLELFFSKGKKKSLFFKVNVFSHLILITAGFLLFFLLEKQNESLSFSTAERALNTFFLSVTSRSGGLSTFDIGFLSEASFLILIILMFIGGSPSSVGGGIRTTTLVVLVAKFIASIKGKEETVLFKKALYEKDINNAFIVFFGFLITYLTFTLIIITIEPYSSRELFFEVMSALTTTGLSTGITSELSTVSKLLLSFLMILGRVGIISLIYSFVKRKKSNIKHVHERIIVG